MQSRAVKIVEGGKLIIPAAFRREMAIGIGDTVVVELIDGELRIRSRKSAIVRVQDRVRQLGTKDASAPDQSEPEVRDEADVEVKDG